MSHPASTWVMDTSSDSRQAYLAGTAAPWPVVQLMDAKMKGHPYGKQRPSEKEKGTS